MKKLATLGAIVLAAGLATTGTAKDNKRPSVNALGMKDQAPYSWECKFKLGSQWHSNVEVGKVGDVNVQYCDYDYGNFGDVMTLSKGDKFVEIERQPAMHPAYQFRLAVFSGNSDRPADMDGCSYLVRYNAHSLIDQYSAKMFNAAEFKKGVVEFMDSLSCVQ